MKNIVYVAAGLNHMMKQIHSSSSDESYKLTDVDCIYLATEHMEKYAIGVMQRSQIRIYHNAFSKFVSSSVSRISEIQDYRILLENPFLIRDIGIQAIDSDPTILSELLKSIDFDESIMQQHLTIEPRDRDIGFHAETIQSVSDTQSTALIPVSTRNNWQTDQLEAEKLKIYLESKFFGQQLVIADLLKSIARRSLRQNPSSLRQSYFMHGPSGTGKTHLATLLADFYESQMDFGKLTIDMSSVASSNQQFELIGLTAGYDTAQAGRLTKFISDNPQGCVVVLDNLDKAHPDCQAVLLEAFDTGYLTDKYQPDSNKKDIPAPIKINPVDCRNAIFVITSNANAEFIESPAFQKMVEESPNTAKRTFIDKLAKFMKSDRSGQPVNAFQPDLLSRLKANTVLIFQPLPFIDMMQIARRKYADSKRKLELALTTTISETDLDICLRAGLFKLGHELNARRVVSDEFTDSFFDPAIRSLRSDASALPIHLQTSPNFSLQIDAGLEGIEDGIVARELFRKGRFLDFDVRVQQADGQVSVILENPVWKKVTRSQDVREGGMLAMAIPDIRFDDIKGHQYAKEKLQEIVKLLKNPASMSQFDIEPPKGLLLYGEPGTGKTMLAKALANEADLPFLSCTGPDLLQIDSHGGRSRLQEIYTTARHYAPSIVFIDEIDILGDRNHGGFSIAINQLLAEIDGFSGTEERVFTVAATNYPERLDPAIVRSGRIELKIHVPRLDKEARRHFLAKIKALPSGANLDIEALLDDTAGMTGAEMEQIQRGLGMYLIKNGGTEITTELAEDIIAIIRYGEKTGVSKDEENRRRVAIHEAGHAIVAMCLKPARIIERITITSRGNAAGFVKFDEEQRLLKTPAHVLNEMAIGLGGRCAQMIQDENTGLDEGAVSDLESVTRYAYLACTVWGFDDEIGWISLPATHNELAFTGMQSKVNERVADWINRSRALAMDVLTKNKALHAELVEMLLKDETLMPIEFEAIKRRVKM